MFALPPNFEEAWDTTNGWKMVNTNHTH